MRSKSSTAEVVVSDTGIGIDPAFLPHIFERFRQADSRLAREHGGLGLGLAISRQIAEMHGGTIEVSSAGPGLGATFRVKLPMMIVDADTELEYRRLHATTAAVREEKPFTFSTLAGVKVLVADDDLDALALIGEILGVRVRR